MTDPNLMDDVWRIYDDNGVQAEGTEEEMRHLFSLPPDSEEFADNIAPVDGDLVLVQIHGRRR